MESDFLRLNPKTSLSMMIKLYKLPDNSIYNWVPLTENNINEVMILFNNYYSKFSLKPKWSYEEFCHYLLPKNNILYTYIHKNPSTQEILGLMSFYSLPSTIINNIKHKKLNIAWCWYMIPSKLNLKEIIYDTLIISKNLGFDVFNCLDIMDYSTIFSDLKFVRGTGELYYYFCNWTCKSFDPNQISLLMI